ncbi:protein artichoke isoform X1 [Cephus cinctus]|uniref:Protein artichoke isoform X1 n=1 Tax=Cephus cinctus TaxID=211228 RepID=A0AAJ7RTY2_CEPCN|nr:protein artichoke isoform X1 [Cephus cinctus]
MTEEWHIPDILRRKRRRRGGGGSRCYAVKIVVAATCLLLTKLSSLAWTAECPSPSEAMLGCSCYNFEDGLFLECAAATEESLRTTLLAVQQRGVVGGEDAVISGVNVRAVVQSLSVYEPDKSILELRKATFPVGTRIRHLQISQSSIQRIGEMAFANLEESLESLAIVSGRLLHVPQKSLAELRRLAVLDLEGNLMQELSSYCFYGLKLIKLSLKANKIGKISEYAFAGLENSLTDLDLGENRLRSFPVAPLRRLESLASLRLAWNEISGLPDDEYSLLGSLLVLDLSSNDFQKLESDCFRAFPLLHSLSLYFNSIESIHGGAFVSLKELESLDLSHNKIVYFETGTFRGNVRLRTIELSHNHVHHVGGTFARLPELQELYLAENNILEIPGEAFVGSIGLTVLDIQQNAIRRVDARALATLGRLSQLHLSNNYIDRMPREFLRNCENLSSLSLDGNEIRELERGTFSGLRHLRELRLQDNQIAEVKRGVFSALPSLLELHLQNNAITHMETGALRSLRSLQHVNLQGNRLVVLADIFHFTSLSPSSSATTSSIDIRSPSDDDDDDDDDQDDGGGSSLVSIQLDSNGLSVLHNDSLRGQTSVRIMWLGHNRLTRLQAPLFRDLLLVERLYLTNNTISRIEDGAFRPMQALKFLELSMNRLNRVTARTFSDLHQLEELYLRDNGLEHLEPYALGALNKLRVLELSNNRLVTLHGAIFLEGLPIERLYLRNCSIEIIELGALDNLDALLELNLQDNRIPGSALGLIRLPRLHVLELSGNDLGHLAQNSLAGLPALEELFAEDSGISAPLPNGLLRPCKGLTHLRLARNRLVTLPDDLLVGLESLRELRLEENEIAEIPYAALSGAPSLELLSLSDNHIRSVEVSRLGELPFLRELDISRNRLERMSGFASANLSRLQSLYLSGNHLSALPENFFGHSRMLRRLDIADNKFHQIPAFALTGQNLPNLSWLNLTRNPLLRIHQLPPNEPTYPNLQEIHISETNLSILTSRDFEPFPGLLHLYLRQNSILRISPSAFRSLPHLLTLHLGTNSLEILPKERLQGMEHLRLLNLTRNRLKDLEEFPADLKSLQILDLSYNQISVLGKITFKNLISLVELHLYGNWINVVSSEAFRPLKKLRLLDLSRNYLENLPLNAFRPLETQIRSLRAEENPLHCGCESQELWEWLRDHQKLVGAVNRRGAPARLRTATWSERATAETNVAHEKSQIDVEPSVGSLRCEQPPELRGLVFLDLDPHAFCSAPLVLKLAIQDIQPFSVLVSWQSRNHSGLYGYQVAYHALDNVDEVKGKLLTPKARSVRLKKLAPHTRYLICVLGLGSWGTPIHDEANPWLSNGSQEEPLESSYDGPLPLMVNSPMSKCTEVRTLDASNSFIGDGNIPDRGGLAGILTRRLGLIVGSCMGFVVFIVLVSVLGYMKMKKQRAALKREQPLPINPPEFMSYRHFSLQSADRPADNASSNLVSMPCPSFIGAIPSPLSTIGSMQTTQVHT